MICAGMSNKTTLLDSYLKQRCLANADRRKITDFRSLLHLFIARVFGGPSDSVPQNHHFTLGAPLQFSPWAACIHVVFRSDRSWTWNTAYQ